MLLLTILLGDHPDKGGGRLHAYRMHWDAWYLAVGFCRSPESVLVMLGLVTINVEWSA